MKRDGRGASDGERREANVEGMRQEVERLYIVIRWMIKMDDQKMLEARTGVRKPGLKNLARLPRNLRGTNLHSLPQTSIQVYISTSKLG
jgi:hypothetical protein